MPSWFIPVFVALALLSFLMTPPTFLADRFIARFAVHPKLHSKDAIYVNGVKLSGATKEDFIVHWNETRFLYRVYDNFDDNDSVPIRISVQERRRNVSFLLFSDGRFIDIIKRSSKRKTIFYRISGEKLENFIRSSLHESAKLVQS